MKFAGQFFAIFLLVLILIATLFAGSKIWLAIAAFIEAAQTLEPKVYVPLVVTIFSATVGLTATLYTQSRTRARELEAAFRERKIEIYLDFLETYEHLLLSAKPELNVPNVDENDLVVSLVKVRTKAVLWGSTGVLKALSEFSKVGDGNPRKMMRVVERIQREMRKDLGLSNFGLKHDFFSELVLSNPDELSRL